MRLLASMGTLLDLTNPNKGEKCFYKVFVDIKQ